MKNLIWYYRCKIYLKRLSWDRISKGKKLGQLKAGRLKSPKLKHKEHRSGKNQGDEIPSGHQSLQHMWVQAAARGGGANEERKIIWQKYGQWFSKNEIYRLPIPRSLINLKQDITKANHTYRHIISILRTKGKEKTLKVAKGNKRDIIYWYTKIRLLVDFLISKK